MYGEDSEQYKLLILQKWGMDQNYHNQKMNLDHPPIPLKMP